MNSAEAEPPPAGLLVIGYGNTLRRDDGAGVWLVRTVASWRLPGVECRTVHQLTPELAEPLSVAQRAVFADARLASRNDLAVRVEPIQPRESAEWSVSAHAGDPAGLLALTRAVSGRCPQAWLITIPAVDLDFGERFSTVTRRGLVEGLGRVAELLRGFAFRPESRP